MQHAKIEVVEYRDCKMLICQIDEKKLIWVEHSHQFILVEEPVFDVLSLLSRKTEVTEISHQLSSIYGLPISECTHFVEEVVVRFTNLTSDKPSEPATLIETNQISFPHFESSSCYQLNEAIRLCIRFQNHQIKHLIHPLFAHLEITETAEVNIEMSLFEWNNLRCISDGKLSVKCFNRDDTPHFKGEVLAKMLNFTYDKTDDDWMMTMHASGVTDGEHAVLFSAGAGSGKSTLSALLQADGFDLLSDDFIAVDQLANAYRFELATSIKEGSYSMLSDYYPELLNKEKSVLSNGKIGCYLPPKRKKTIHSKFPIKSILFVEYDTTQSCRLSRISNVEAVQLLLQEVFVTPTYESVTHFMQLMSRTQFYTLHYSNNEEALRQIRKLFSDEE